VSEVLLNEEESQAVEEGAACQHLLLDPTFLSAIEAVADLAARGETILAHAETITEHDAEPDDSPFDADVPY